MAIVGSGFAGLACADLLASRGVPVTLFDKGRGPGGRASTRRASPSSASPGSAPPHGTGHEAATLTFDHGAQYFTARGAELRERVLAWESHGVVAEWRPRLAAVGRAARTPSDEPPERWVGTPGMSSLLAHLERGQDVRRPVRVDAIDGSPRGWSLHDADGGVHGPFAGVVVAVPAPQAATLLSVAPALASAASGVRMPPCWTVLAAWPRPVEAPFDAAFVEGSPLAWLARDSSKPGRAPGERWVLHGAPDWTRDHLEAEPAAVTRELLRAAEEAWGVEAGEPSYAAAHRWRYARVDGRVDGDCLWDPALGLGACGDWCVGGRMEGAWTSGRTVARRLLETSRDA